MMAVEEAPSSWAEQHGCHRKKKYGAKGAREAAGDLRRRGSKVSAYRCPWCSGWHVGHTPSMEGLEAIAREIRERSGNAPGPTHG